MVVTDAFQGMLNGIAILFRRCSRIYRACAYGGTSDFNSKVIAARGTKIFEAGTTGSWSEIDTGSTSAGRYTFFRYNLAGTDFIIWADGANHATKYDGTTVTDINASGAPANPKFVTGFKDHLFFAGMSSTPQELTFTAPFTDNDFQTSNGAGTIKVDSNIYWTVSVS